MQLDSNQKVDMWRIQFKNLTDTGSAFIDSFCTFILLLTHI